MAGERVETRVAILGAGPAGLMLGRMLDLAGIENVIVEAHDREYVEQRQRAGVLEQGTTDFISDLDVAERMKREGLVHRGLELRFGAEPHRIALDELTDGRGVTVYGQTEIVKDFIAARLRSGGPLLFESRAIAIEGIDGANPVVRVRSADAELDLRAEFVAACDGFHGIGRSEIPEGHLSSAGFEYPYCWLGILAEVEPSSEELIYCHSDRGFALHSMRSRDLSRLFIQVPADERIEDWSDDRIWHELQQRFALDGWSLNEGPIIQKAIAAMRSFVAWPLRHGSLLLAGDACHIVPPTGAKGLNLAAHDARVLGQALIAALQDGDPRPLDSYSDTCLRRVWRAQDFAYWMTKMLHKEPDDLDGYNHRRQLAQLAYVCSSEPAARTLAENYVGMHLA